MPDSDVLIAISFVLVGAAIIVTSGPFARAKSTRRDGASRRSTVSFWRLHWDDIPEDRIKWIGRAIGVAVLSMAVRDLLAAW